MEQGLSLLQGAGGGISDLRNGFWGDWWPTITWGSAGEWVGGLGALAALGVSLYLLRQTIQDRQFSDARSFSAHHKWTRIYGMAAGEAIYELSGRNNGTRPLTDIYIDSFQLVGDKVYRMPRIVIEELKPEQ